MTEHSNIDSRFENLKELWMHDIRAVGENKPLGYLPVETIIDCNEEVDSVITEAVSRGNHAKILKGPTVPGIMGSLYVYNYQALQTLLDSNKETLISTDWPTNAEHFVERVATVHASVQTPLYDLIADAFGDYKNPFRTDLGETQ